MALDLADAPTEPAGHETQPVDVTQVRRRVLPFAASAATSRRVAGAPSGADRNSGAPDAAETVLLSLGDGRRRLVRFDPQTGRPLARPYWELVPAETSR